MSFIFSNILQTSYKGAPHCVNSSAAPFLTMRCMNMI